MRRTTITVALLALALNAHAENMHFSEYTDQHIRGQFTNPSHPSTNEGTDAEALSAPRAKRSAW